MKISDQVCTLEQGQRLQDLGITGPSLFWYSAPKSGKHRSVVQYGHSTGCIAPAFTSSELGRMLPWGCSTTRSKKAFGRWLWSDLQRNAMGIGFKSEAESKADHLIKLIETRNITVHEANKRLSHD